MSGINLILERELEFLKESFTEIKTEDNFFYGIYEAADGGTPDAAIDEYLNLSSTSFIRSEYHVKGNKRFSDTASPIFQHNRGNIPIDFFGQPFTFESTEIKHCLHGTSKDSRGGKKGSCSGDHDYGKNYQKLQGTRKLDCPATMQIRGIRVYEGYSVDKAAHATPNSLKKAKQEAIDRLKKAATTTSRMKYFVRIPLCTVHNSHPLGIAASANQLVDKRLISKVYALVQKGITRPDEVRRCLEEYVERDLFPNKSTRPRKTNRRYYPTRQDLRNHISKAIAADRHSNDDQESLRIKIDEWQKSSSDTKFFYRPKEDQAGTANSKFLFVHQEEWQRELIRKYGTDLVLMDATYKTTKYSLPLFFVCVHTNIGYRVVAEFICESEDAASISEALTILKGWNDWWDPKYFMIDYSTAEINAIEGVFPNALIYICDFHRLQAWKRWLPRSGLNSPEQAALYCLLKRVADARQLRQYEKAVADLRASPVYTSSDTVRVYVERSWMSCVKRWAKVFREQQVLNIVNTNNGVEAQNKHFKYMYLPRSVDKSLYAIVVVIVESFLPESYQSYCDLNLRQSSNYRRFSNIPSYLHNRPVHFIKHCLKSRFAAGDFGLQDVQCIDVTKGQFRVKASKDAQLMYTVDLLTPCCTCEAWLKTQFPCKHIFAVFNVYGEWGFERLPYTYKNSPFITLDTSAHTVTCSPPTIHDDNDNSDNKDDDGDDDDDDDDRDDGISEVTKQGCNEDDGMGQDKSDDEQQVDVPPTEPIPSGVDCTKVRSQVLQELTMLRDVIYRVDDISSLTAAMAKMVDLRQHLQTKTSADVLSGLPLRLSPTKKRLKVTSMDYHKVLRKPLPKRKKKKKKKFMSTVENVVPDNVAVPDTKVVENPTVDMVIDISDSEDGDEEENNQVAVTTLVQQSPQGSQTVDPKTRVKVSVHDMKLDPTKKLLDYAEFNVSPADLFTLFPPRDLSKLDIAAVRQKTLRFTPGWLTDTIIDAVFSVLGKMAPGCDVLPVETSLCMIIQSRYSTRLTWNRVDFKQVNMMLIPIQSSHHWTLLVIDKPSRKRLYIDPKSDGDVGQAISEPAILRKINPYSDLVDLKTGWRTLEWPCIRPKHVKQKDGINCGVFICRFAWCLIHGADLQSPFNPNIERDRLLSLLFGSCYDDINSGRNINICKVCKQDDNEDWLGCDRCEQYFHASCVGVDFATALSLPFYCP